MASHKHIKVYKQIRKHPNTEHTLSHEVCHVFLLWWDRCYKTVSAISPIHLMLELCSGMWVQYCPAELPGHNTVQAWGTFLSLCVCVCVCALWPIVIQPPTWAPPTTPLYSPQILSLLQCVDMQTNANRVNMFECLHLNEKKQSLILCQNRGEEKKQAKEFPVAVEMLTVLWVR